MAKQESSQALLDAPAPAAPQESNPRRYWLPETEDFLEKCGWVRLGQNRFGMSTWRDGNRETKARIVQVMLPSKEKGTEVINQWEGPPADWVYTTEQALAIQKERDRDSETLQRQIDRKEEELKILRAKLAESKKK